MSHVIHKKTLKKVLYINIFLCSDCIDDDIIPAQDCYDCLFELYLAMIRVGPGTSHYEVMDKLTDIGEMNDYLKVGFMLF